jgi:hypothetical protein
MSFSSNHYRDREKYREVRERWKSKYRVKTGAYKWFSRWKEGDIRRVMEHSIPDRELSKEIEHSVSAIQKKRWEMNRKDVC